MFSLCSTLRLQAKAAELEGVHIWCRILTNALYEGYSEPWSFSVA
jgi:hypothetical protein